MKDGKSCIRYSSSDSEEDITMQNFPRVCTLLTGSVWKLVDWVNKLIRSTHCLEYCRVYESQHMNYIHEAEQRLKEIHALPGPIFTVGLSMGGATALALAATHPNEIAKTAVFAPLFKVIAWYSLWMRLLSWSILTFIQAGHPEWTGYRLNHLYLATQDSNLTCCAPLDRASHYELFWIEHSKWRIGRQFISPCEPWGGSATCRWTWTDVWILERSK